MNAKKILAFILAFAMVFSTMSISVFAADITLTETPFLTVENAADWTGNTITIDGENFDYYNNETIHVKGDVVLENVTINATKVTASNGLFYISGDTTLTFKNCTINVSESPNLSKVFSHEDSDNAKVVFEGTTLNADKVQRGFYNMEVEMTDSTLNLTNLSDHAFRSVTGSIADTDVTINGAETFLRGSDIAIVGTSTVEVSNTTHADGAISESTLSATPDVEFTGDKVTEEMAETVGAISIGGKYYTTFSDAIAAATDDDNDGVITYQIHGKVIVDKSGWVSPRGTSGATTINFVGKTDDAEICINSTSAAIIATDGPKDSDMVAINYKDLILSKLNGFYLDDYGHANRLFTTWMRGAVDGGLVTYTDCVFTNGTCNNQYGKTIYTDCTFNNPDYYGLWIYGGEVEVVRGTFEAARGVQAYSEGNAEITTTITDSTFDIEEKPAIVSASKGTLTLENVDASACEYGLLETKGKDGNPDNGYATIEVDGKTPAYVASKGGIFYTDLDYAQKEAGDAIETFVATVTDANGVITSYASLAEAFEAVDSAAKAGATIDLVADVTLTEGVEIMNSNVLSGVTLDGNSHTITLDMNGAGTGIRFGGQWATGVEIVDLTITGSAKYALWLNGGTSSVITNLTLTGDYDDTYGGLIFYGTHGATLTNCNIVSGFTNGQDDNPLNLVNTKFGYLLANNSEVPDEGAKIFIDKDSSIDKLFCGGSNSVMIDPASLQYVGKVTFETNPQGAVASVDGILYASLDAALAAAEAGDTVDLLGNVVDLPETNVKITKDLTITNGTIDITNGTWNGNAIIEVCSGTEADKVEVTFDNVDFVGDNYSSAYGVIYAHDHGKAIITNCDFDLSNEQFSAGGVLKGDVVGNSNFDVSNSTFELENPNRIIANATVNLDNVTINAKVTDDTLIVGEMNNHAFRNLVGTVNNSKISVDGFETGIKNTDGDLAITGNSFVVLTNSKDTDLIVGTGKTVEVEEGSKLYADTTDIADDAAVSGDGFVAKADTIYVQYKKTDIDADGNDNLEGKDTYEIVLAGADAEKINELASADLTFAFTGDSMSYTVTPAKGVALSHIGDRYMFNYDGITKYEETGAAIVIGTIEINGYGAYTLSTADADTNAVYATEIADNIVDGFTPAAGLITNDDMVADDGMVGKITDGNIAVPTRTLTVDITFPNAVEDNVKAYQTMSVSIVGGTINETIALGTDGEDYNFTRDLPYNTPYTVTVSGAGYRTARYTVTLNEDKTLNFWNNIKDAPKAVEDGKDSSARTVTFLAGDIVADEDINIYDLSAVVSYFGETELKDMTPEEYAKYVKYDLNRDGKIDSKDVAYVLASWEA